ncbi:MAG TPA: ABC transporter permease, partial [bacterium]|nr:ABC transporter permease [bacterium]
MVRIAQGSRIVVSIMLISIILGSLESIRFALGRDIFTYGMDIFAVSPYLTEEMNLEQLTWEDARAIADIPGVRSVDSIKISRAEVLIYDTQTNMNITYTTPDFIDISGRKITDGRNFRSTDFAKSYRV